MKKYLLLLSIIVLFTGCSINQNSGVKNDSKAGVRKIEKLSEEYNKYSIYDECSFDLNSDNKNEKITLFTDAKINDEGLIENDGNIWSLVVYDNENSDYYVLFNEYIKHGNVRFQIVDYLNKTEVVPSILLYNSSSAKIEILKFSCKEKDFFACEKIYDSNEKTDNGINLKYSSR